MSLYGVTLFGAGGLGLTLTRDGFRVQGSAPWFSGRIFVPLSTNVEGGIQLAKVTNSLHFAYLVITPRQKD